MNMFPALAIVVAAKIRADEETKKAADAPKTLPPVGLTPAIPMAPTFQVGTAVRDILSGMTGIVVDPIDGNFGDLIFVKCDADNQTYPIRSDQIERIESAAPLAPPATLPPVPAAAAAPVPAAEALAEGAEEKPKVGAKASLFEAGAVVSDPSDRRNITFASILERVSKKPITAAALIQSFGYVPENFDKVVASLAAAGITVLRSGKRPDVRSMVAKGMNAREVVAEACAAAGPVRNETLRRIAAVRAGSALAARLKAAIADNKAKVAAAQECPACNGVGRNLCKACGGSGYKRLALRRVKAEMPTKPKPAKVLPSGLVYAWNTQVKDWDVIELKAAVFEQDSEFLNPDGSFNREAARASLTSLKNSGALENVELFLDKWEERIKRDPADDAAAEKAVSSLKRSDWDSAYKKFPRYNNVGPDTDKATEFLMKKAGGDKLSEAAKTLLHDMIYDGLT